MTTGQKHLSFIWGSFAYAGTALYLLKHKNDTANKVGIGMVIAGGVGLLASLFVAAGKEDEKIKNK